MRRSEETERGKKEEVRLAYTTALRDVAGWGWTSGQRTLKRERTGRRSGEVIPTSKCLNCFFSTILFITQSHPLVITIKFSCEFSINPGLCFFLFFTLYWTVSWIVFNPQWKIYRNEKYVSKKILFCYC